MQRETCQLKKKIEDGENLLFKALVNRFWLIYCKSCSWFNKVVDEQPFIKWTS